MDHVLSLYICFYTLMPSHSIFQVVEDSDSFNFFLNLSFQNSFCLQPILKQYLTFDQCYFSAKVCSLEAEVSVVNSYVVIQVKLRSFQRFIVGFTPVWMSFRAVYLSMTQFPVGMPWVICSDLFFCVHKQTPATANKCHEKQPHIHTAIAHFYSTIFINGCARAFAVFMLEATQYVLFVSCAVS